MKQNYIIFICCILLTCKKDPIIKPEFLAPINTCEIELEKSVTKVKDHICSLLNIYDETCYNERRKLDENKLRILKWSEKDSSTIESIDIKKSCIIYTKKIIESEKFNLFRLPNDKFIEYSLQRHNLFEFDVSSYLKEIESNFAKDLPETGFKDDIYFIEIILQKKYYLFSAIDKLNEKQNSLIQIKENLRPK